MKQHQQTWSVDNLVYTTLQFFLTFFISFCNGFSNQSFVALSLSAPGVPALCLRLNRLVTFPQSVFYLLPLSPSILCLYRVLLCSNPQIFVGNDFWPILPYTFNIRGQLLDSAFDQCKQSLLRDIIFRKEVLTCMVRRSY